jgi:hypothetical protein
VGKPKGKKSHESPKRRWEDNIKMDLRDVGWRHGLSVSGRPLLHGINLVRVLACQNQGCSVGILTVLRTDKAEGVAGFPTNT